MSFSSIITGASFLGDVRYALADGEEWRIEAKNEFVDSVTVEVIVNGVKVPTTWNLPGLMVAGIELFVPDVLKNFFTFDAPSRKGSGEYTNVLVRPVFDSTGDNAPGAVNLILIDIADPNYV